MTSPEGTSGGSLHVGVEGDTSGFARGLQAKIDAETRNIRARIQLEVDSRRLAVDMRSAAKDAERSTGAVKVKMAVDSTGFAANVDKAVREAQARIAAIKVGLTGSLDMTEVKARIDAFNAGRPQINLHGVLDMSGVERDLAAARVAAERKKWKIDLGIGGGGDGGIKGLPDIGKMIGLAKLPAIAGLIGVAIAAVGQLAAGLVAVGGAALQAGGLIAAIPAAASGLGLIVGTIMAGFKGIGKASQALSKEQSGGASQAQAQADARAAAAKRVAAAIQGIKDAQEQADLTSQSGADAVASARKNVADTLVSGAQRVATAEQTYARAVRDSTAAQVALNVARAEAKQRLIDLSLQIKDAALNEEGAKLAIEEAKKSLDAANASPTSTDLQRREADLAYRQALQNLADLQNSNKVLAATAADAAAKGVEGADTVVQAKQNEIDAIATQKQAEKDLAAARKQEVYDNQKAQKDLAKTIADSNRANRDALRSVAAAYSSLADAQHSQAEANKAMGADASAVKTAFDGLSPAGQAFSKFLSGTLMPVLKKVKFAAQEALLPPVQNALKSLITLAPNVETAVAGMGKAIGGLATQAAALMTTGPFRADFDRIMQSNTRAFTNASPGIISLISAFRTLAVTAGPIVEKIGTAFSHLAARIDQYLKAQRAIGEADPKKGLAGVFQRAYDTAAQLGRIIGNVIGALVNLGRAGSTSGHSLLDSFEKATQKLQDLTGSVKGQNVIKRYFADSAGTLRETGKLIDDLVLAILKIGQGSGVAPLIKQIRTELLPSLVTMFTSLNHTFGPALVNLLTSVSKLFAALSSAGGAGGGLTAFANVLDVFTKALTTLVSIPGVGPVLTLLFKTLATGAAVAGVVGFLAKKFGPLIGAIKEVVFLAPALRTGFIQGKDAALDFIKGMAGLIRSLAIVAANMAKTAALAAGRFVRDMAIAAKDGLVEFAKSAGRAVKGLALMLYSMARTAVLKAYAAAMWLVNAAMDANPITLIVLAIAALVAGFVLAYTHSARFRAIVQGALKAVGDAAKWVFDWVKKNWPLLLGILLGPFGLLVALVATHFDQFKAILSAVFGFIANVAQAGWAAVSGIFSAALGAIRAVVGFVFGAIRAYFVAIFTVYRVIFTTAFNVLHAVVSTVFGAIRNTISGIWNAITALFRASISTITGVFRGLWNGLSDIVGSVFGGIRSTISSILSTIKGSFATAVSAITTTWGKLRDAVAAPIRFVVDTVYNNGIRKVWNAVAGLVHFGTLPEFKFAGGGTIPGYAPGRDSVHILASPGEGILTPQATRMVGGAGGIRAINDAAGRSPSQTPSGPGAVAFAGGGIIGGLKDIGSGIIGGAKDAGGYVLNKAQAALNKLQGVVFGALGKLDALRKQVQIGANDNPILQSIKAVLDKGLVGLWNAAKHAVTDGAKALIPGLSAGATVLPRAGGTVARLAEAGRSEAIVDEGLLNKRLAEMDDLRSLLKAIVDNGGIHIDQIGPIYNPVPETPSETLNTRLRGVGAFGLFQGAKP